jgi:hypothetical protein
MSFYAVFFSDIPSHQPVTFDYPVIPIVCMANPQDIEKPSRFLEAHNCSTAEWTNEGWPWRPT